jgi:hypothetical protein
MHNAKITSDELKAFYTARAKIEEEYAKSLLALARKPLGSAEGGTLRMSLDVVRSEVESMGKAHQLITAQMKSELEEPLAAFTGGIKERRKIVQNGIEKLLKTKNQQTFAVNKTRDRFEQDCLKIKGYLAQGHMVMGQEERKNKAKLEKTQIQMSSNSGEYESAVKILEETTGRWNREWKAACDKFQDLEEERLDFFKSSLWSFANISSTVCVSDDQSCEKMRLSLEDCEVEKDITTFIQECGTGQEIPDPPKYINFCRGDIDDASSVHESDDGNYSVAQFQRTMNPTFRTSSPQPSTYESHHDPDNNLREELGMPPPRTSLQHDGAFTVVGNTSQGSAAVNPLASSQNSMSHNAANVPVVPHNPYPTDGMTQFCRTAPPPSNVGSAPAPIRSESREERSDYSAPNSFEDNCDGSISPIKQLNGSELSGMSSNYNGSNVSSIAPQNYNGSDLSAVSSHYNDSAISGVAGSVEDQSMTKKKGNFFSSHSPFKRRQSMKEKQVPQMPAQQIPQSGAPTPTSRNTWTPATMRKAESANTSPTKPFGNSNTLKSSPWNRQPSTEPEPVDPRAEYQLGIGNSVFDVASPNSPKKGTPQKPSEAGLDPIAQALAELKGVSKHASVRQSADRHYGMSTPTPGTPAMAERTLPPGAVPTPFAGSNFRDAPPAYDTPVSRLGAPQPAHTSREMRKTTEQYTGQKREMFNNGAAARPTSSIGRPGPQQRQEPPRSVSPAPARSASPRPLINTSPRQPQQHVSPQQQPMYRSTSPNPYSAAGVPRPRAQSSGPAKPQAPFYSNHSRGNSPSFQAAPQPRAASPNPAYAPANNQPRPLSSRGGPAEPSMGSSPGGGGGGAMALQLAPVPDSPYGQQRTGRPQSQYYPNDPAAATANNQVGSPRVRSQSVAGNRQVTKGGIPILHYGKLSSSSALHPLYFTPSLPPSPIRRHRRADVSLLFSSSCNVHVPSRHPRGIILRQGRCPRRHAPPGRRLVGGRGRGETCGPRVGAEQLFEELLSVVLFFLNFFFLNEGWMDGIGGLLWKI